MATSPAPALGLVDALVQLSFAIQTALASVAAEHDLSVTQMRLLGIVRDREPAMLDIARVLNLEKSSVTGLVDRAQRRGLVQRVEAEHDGRAVLVRITAEGQAITARFAARVADHVAALTADLSAKDRTQLARLATRVVGADAARRGFALDGPA